MDSEPNMDTKAVSAVRPGYSVGHFYLIINGENAGFISSVEGGEITGEVVELNQPNERFIQKTLGSVKYEDVIVAVDLSLDPIFYAWISDTLQQKNLRRDVTVLTLDNSNKVRRRVDFIEAYIKEITFPKNDASSKDPCYLTVKFSPEYTRAKKGDGSKAKAQIGPAKKKWLPSNFRLQIDGLDCTKVNAIDALTIKQKIQEDAIGERRESVRVPGRLEFPNLQVTLPETAADTFVDWHTDFVIKGNSGSDQEKQGRLTYLSPDLKTTLGELTFTNLGIFRISPGKREANSEQIHRLRADLYVEQIGFALGGKPE